MAILSFQPFIQGIETEPRLESVEIPLSTSVDTYACNYLWIFDGFDCNSVRKPRVKLVDFQNDKLYGRYYPGSGEIQLNIKLDPKWIPAVMLHELMHHYGYEGSLPWGLALCSSEARARAVTDLFVGRPYSDDWRTWYGCTKD